jgi:hypothetical protein
MGQSEALEFPALQPGVQLLDTDDRFVEALHALALDHQLSNDGTAYWVDSQGHATTTSLARLAPSRRLLDSIQVARGFTAYQHYSLVDQLLDVVDQSTSLVVAPNVDRFYRADALRRGDPEAMLGDVIDRLEKIAERYDLPVLVTRERRDALSAPLTEVAATEISCERTRFGPRFSSDRFDSLVYPAGDGWFQTTLAYWREVLQARINTQQQPEGVSYGAD